MASVGVATAAISLGVAILGSAMGLHRVPEGHVAVYYRGGALMRKTAQPGFRFMPPLVTRVHYVQTTVQTDKVTNIPCGTSGGTLIHFDRIEAVNQLRADLVYDTVKNYTVDYDKTWIYDKIHHEINQMCSRSTLEEMYITRFDSLDETLRDALQSDIDRHAPGINILAIRVTKPRIPSNIARHFEEIESERTKVKVAEQTQRLVEKAAETEKKAAVIEAEKLAAVEAVELERSIKLKENQQRVASIENEMINARTKAEADAELYRAQKQAEANKMRLTPELLQWEAVRALANNTKVFWGDKLPSLYADGAKLLG